jgi:hypothetical protein
MVDYEHGDDEPQHAVLSWLSTDPTTALPEVGTELVRCSDYEKLEEELALLRSNLDQAQSVIEKLEAELAGPVEPADPLEGLPPELAKALRDPGIIVSQDQSVFELIAAWQNAPSDTPSSIDYGPFVAAIATQARNHRDQELRERLESAFVVDAVARMLVADEEEWKKRGTAVTEDAREMLLGLASLLFLLDGTDPDRLDSIFEEDDDE